MFLVFKNYWGIKEIFGMIEDEVVEILIIWKLVMILVEDDIWLDFFEMCK